MTTTNHKCQAVFLIDTFVEDYVTNYERHISDFCKTISLSTLRILSYLSSETPLHGKQKKSTNTFLRWGYKFFDSRSHSLKVEKYSFKEFKLKYFEEFEREVQKRFRALTESNSKAHHNRLKENKKSPCDCFNKTLAELIDDYEWETPDLFSPVKRKRFNRKKDAYDLQQEFTGNFVFIYSVCPKSESRLRQFAKKKVLDSHVFLDSLLPASLFTKFCGGLKIKLFWIDTDICVHDIPPHIESLKLVECALELANGKVIPIDSVIQHGKQQFSHLTIPRIDGEEITTTGENEKDEKKKEISSSILPFTALFQFYLSKSNSRNLKVTHQESSQYQCVLMYKELKICDLEISATQNSTIKNKICNSKEASASVNLTITGKEINIHYKDVDFNVLKNVSTLEVYSTFKPSSFLQSCFHGNEIFVCVGLDSDSGEIQQRSDRFYKLMSYLLKEQFQLVLLSKDTSRFFLLKPLTATSATLVVISTEVVLQMEKHILLQSNITFTEENGSKTDVANQNWRGLMSRLCSNQASNFKHLKSNVIEVKKNDGVGMFNPRCVDKTHLPGCQTPFISLIDKLNDRVSQLEFLSENEVRTLKQLQKMYHVQSRPPQLIDHTPQPKGLNDSDINSSVVEDIKDDKKTDSLQSRGQMIVTRSKQAVKEKSDEVIKTVEEAPVKKPVTTLQTNVDFKDEEELKVYLNDMYDKTAQDNNSSLFSSIQPLVTVTLYYMRQSGKDNPQESCEQLLRSGIILSAEELRQKHQNDNDKQLKIREYQLQIILRLEVQSMVHGGDQNASMIEDKVEEIATLLRTISFITEPKVLSEFMKNSLVDNPTNEYVKQFTKSTLTLGSLTKSMITLTALVQIYPDAMLCRAPILFNFVHSLPQMLGSIYDELMQPYPAELESILSPDQSMGDSSVLNQSLQSCGEDISMSQPTSAMSDILLNRQEKSSRSRKLVHHPSLVDFGPKRQIVVATKSGKDQKIEIKQKRKDKDREKRKLERRQSVAVMETVKTSSKKRSRSVNILKSPKFANSTRRLVSETPAHKQKKNNMWKRLEKERRHTQSVIDVKVVAESPIKTDFQEKDSPSQKKRALTTLRRSFYSAGPVNRSRSLTSSLELADRIAGRNSNYVKKTKRQSLFNLKSPDRNSSFLLSQLMGSPESARRTPGKKFSLSQALQSPSQNTRSKTPSKAISSQKSLFNEKSPKRSIKKLSFTPVKKSSSQDVIIPDSPCLHTRSHTPSKVLSGNTPSKSPAVSLLLSPSQNTRSKVTATPTRHSVKAKLFVRSPELKMNSKTTENFMSPMKSMKGKRALNLDDKENNVNSKIELNVTNQSVESKQESAFNHNNPTEKTPSPTRKLIIKTPNSIDCWPRKKKWTKIKYDSSPKLNNNGPLESLEENGSIKDSHSNGSSSDDEISVQINDRIDGDERLQTEIDTLVSPKKPRTSSKRSLAMSPDSGDIDLPSKRRCFSLSQNYHLEKRDENQKDETAIQTMSRKRNLNISPEKVFSSPSKRQRISFKDPVNSPKRDLPEKMSFHSHVLTRNFSTASEGVLSSQGFDTNFTNSQGSFNSQNILSLISNDSQDYFSASNDEVFLSPTRRSRTSSQLSQSHCTEVENSNLADVSNISDLRSDSPVFGSSKKGKSNLQSRFKSIENNPNIQDIVSTVKSPCRKVLQSDDSSSKVSPSARKYSPNVSAKSLCHLISSPILNSDTKTDSKDDGSPKIDQDSLNVRRQKMSGRIRRSLMQN